ncbi:MAG TPA: DUF4037 domain-containing protein [Spirochaetia bacterium]|nr:DUF4037 domain-containing protein [Spirochaetia bacterium]
MQRKVRKIASGIAERIGKVDGVLAILLGEAADIEAIDPYFTIDLDVFVDGQIPTVETRRGLLGDAEAFETSPVSAVDRFLIDKLPASLHFIRTDDVDRMLLRIAERSWVFHEPGTNTLYRLERGEVMFSREGWLEGARAALAHVPPQFWWQARLRAFAMAERALTDLGAAAHRSDDLFFTVSSARLIRSVASFLFAVNRQFEPSDRMLAERIQALPKKPDELSGRLDSFMRPEGKLSKMARREIAELLVRSLLPLAVEESA